MRFRKVARVALAACGILVAGPARAASGAAAAAAAGVALYEAGDARGAVARFEEALALEPGSAPARRNLALALAAAGRGELRAGRVEEARALLERARGLAPDEAGVHLLLALAFQRRGDLYEARQGVRRALELAPGLSEAHELSGDLHYQEGALEPARREWEAALPGAGPRADALRAKLERLGREAPAEAGFGRDVSPHFTVQFDGPVPREVARTALRLLEAAHGRLWRELGRPPQSDIPVILYSRELFGAVTRSPAWVGGSYDGKIRVPVGGLADGRDAERLGPVLAHELTHAFVRAAAPPGALPLWFEEGLAMHFQGMGADEAAQALGGRRAAFPSLAAVSAALRAGPDVAAAYAAAALALAEMVRRDGLWLPRRTLERASAGVPFPEAFREAAGVDLAEFEQGWLRRLP